MNFASTIIKWYGQNKRDLPWRDTSDPYKIWLSEIILQQTRVDQGLPYYQKFVGAFPSITHLANAQEDEVLKLWQGLGYYSRARNLHATAKRVRDSFDGQFPEEYTDILDLKGVGEYTAAAIASFSYNLPYPVVDGNVIRVLSRVFGVYQPVDSKEGLKELKLIANRELDKEHPASYNQAIMEFGALQCVPVSPNCEQCPLAGTCIAQSRNEITELPFKQKKTKVKEVYFYYAVLGFQDGFFMKRRNENGIWKGLYDFPVVESEVALEEHVLMESFNKLVEEENHMILINISENQKHILSHRKINARFFRFELNNMPVKGVSGAQWFSVDKILEKGVPRLIERYFETINLYK